ncbi:tapasin [Varanus komodoensis]|uniref:tapasin n=1 Tax=Varanus komodoensis TaxID=61221 RepID=UPI001CF78CFF|nr:tapasin [Varanus komodoensis]
MAPSAFNPPVGTKGTLLLFLFGLASAAPRLARLNCWFVEEAGGGGSVMPSALRQRPALLLLPPPGRRLEERDLEPELPPEVESGLAFQILDASGVLWGGRDPSAEPLWPEAEATSTGVRTCEINAYLPQEAHVAWAAGLVGQRGCPRTLEAGQWFIATLQSPMAGYGVSSIMNQGRPLVGKQTLENSPITTVTAVLSVFSWTPRLQARVGQDVLLDCGFSGPEAAFSVEWRHQYSGAGHVVLAYDGAARRITVAEEGAQLFLQPGGGGSSSNVSLHLQNVRPGQEGTYICTVYLPYLHAQQAMELQVVEPPKVTFRPTPLTLAPSAPAELACEVSGYYPQSASVTWMRRDPHGSSDVIADSWETGHRQSPDGTYSFTSFARLPPIRPEDHGASYSCHVAHAGLGDVGLRKAAKLRVAGQSGPSLEDAIGLFLLAFLLFGVLQLLFRHAAGETTKTEKLE